MVSEAPFALAAVPSHHRTEQTAQVQGEARWTWAALDQRARQWAHILLNAGVGADDLVAFALPNGSEFFALTFGIYMAGATPAPLSPKLPPVEIEEILAQMQPAARAELLPDSVPFPTSASSEASWAGQVAASWKACTSGGSTGRPKVIIDGRSAAFARDAAFLEIPACGRVLVPGPLYHNGPFSAAIFALLRGNTVVTMPRFDAAMAIEIIAAEKISWAMMVPTMLQRILRLDLSGAALDHWKLVVHTAAPMPRTAKQQWIEQFGPDHIGEVYGATEGLVRTWINGREWLERPGSVGRATGGARIRVLADDGSDCPVGTLGEIYAMPPGGPGSSYRYLGASRRATCDGWESVGDIGYLDAGGFLYLADRRDDMIVSGGVNVWPAEVEAAIARHPSIISCAAVGVPDDDLGQHVHALIETNDPALDRDSLRAFLRDHLPPEKIPRSVAISPGPVRDDAGKVRRQAVVENYIAACRTDATG